MERIAEKEVERTPPSISAIRNAKDMCLGGSNDSSIECRCCLGIFPAGVVLPLEFKPAHSVGGLLTQHLDELEQGTGSKGGVMQLLIDHFVKIYKIDPPLAA